MVERRIVFPLLKWLMVINIFLWRILALAHHQFDAGMDYPVAICSMSMILLAVYLWWPKQLIFDIIFYWILVGSSLALLLPDLIQPFPSMRFFAMFITHSVNVFVMFYLVIIRRIAPSQTSYNKAFLTLALYGIVIALPLDLTLHANYMFTLQPPDIDFAPVALLPSWPWYWLVLLGFFYLVFRLTSLVYVHYFHPELHSKNGLSGL